MLYSLRVVCEMDTPGLPAMPGCYARHKVCSEDANVLMQIGTMMHRYDPNFVSAMLVSPEDREISFIDGREIKCMWVREEPAGFVS